MSTKEQRCLKRWLNTFKRCFYIKTTTCLNTYLRVEIPALSQVDVESQVASVERVLNSYKKTKTEIISY